MRWIASGVAVAAVLLGSGCTDEASVSCSLAGAGVAIPVLLTPGLRSDAREVDLFVCDPTGTCTRLGRGRVEKSRYSHIPVERSGPEAVEGSTLRVEALGRGGRVLASDEKPFRTSVAHPNGPTCGAVSLPDAGGSPFRLGR